MPKYEVTLQVFAAGGETYQVEAADRDEAEKIATHRARRDYNNDLIRCDLQEICINEVIEYVLPTKGDYREIVDPIDKGEKP